MQWDPFQCKFADSYLGGSTSLFAFCLQQATISVTTDTAVYSEECYSDCDPKYARNLCQSHIYQGLTPPPRRHIILFLGIYHVSAGGNSDAVLRKKKLASTESPHFWVARVEAFPRTARKNLRPKRVQNSGPALIQLDTKKSAPIRPCDKTCTPLTRSGPGFSTARGNLTTGIKPIENAAFPGLAALAGWLGNCS